MFNANNLRLLTTKELQEKYSEIFKTPAPIGFTKSYLIKEILWQSNYCNLPIDLQKHIIKLTEDYENNKTIDCKKAKRFSVTAGTKFVREFRGQKYEVIAVDGGFKFNEEFYKSLSAIANEITGTRWNGKKFFGVI